MTARDVAFGSLLPPIGNPRKVHNEASIKGLAESIAAVGIIQNLVVRPEGKDRYRVVVGKRRYLALKHLHDERAIDDAYLVPVSVRKKLRERDADRMATVENVQREPMHPIDDAESFAKLLQDGGDIANVAAEVGVSVATVRRRVALASLCEEVKGAAREGVISLSIAEALTLASEAQQLGWLKEIVAGAEVDAEEIREEILSAKPTVAIARFPLERYQGSLTRDLFSDDETTYFDDIEQFLMLQKQAVEELTEEHRQAGRPVELLEGFQAPWWHYRKAEEGEASAVVIHFSPSGQVEVQEGLVKHEVTPRTVAATQATPLVRSVKERRGSELSGATVQAVAYHQSVIVQAALFDDARKAKEVTAALLLLGHGGDYGARLRVHEAVAAIGTEAATSPAYLAIERHAAGFVERLPSVATQESDQAMAAWQRLFRSITNASTVLQAVVSLDDDELDALILLCAVTCLGRSNRNMPDPASSLFSLVARRMAIDIRRYWRPDRAFLMTLRREELEQAAIESGASIQLPKLKGMNKRELVTALTSYFERTANPDAELDEHDAKGRTWVPACMALTLPESAEEEHTRAA